METFPIGCYPEAFVNDFFQESWAMGVQLLLGWEIDASAW
jgi:hypothetical protein